MTTSEASSLVGHTHWRCHGVADKCKIAPHSFDFLFRRRRKEDRPDITSNWQHVYWCVLNSCDIFLRSPTAGSFPWSPHGAVRTECAVDMHARQCARQMHVNHQFFTQNTCRSRVHVKLCRPVKNGCCIRLFHIVVWCNSLNCQQQCSRKFNSSEECNFYQSQLLKSQLWMYSGHVTGVLCRYPNILSKRFAARY